MGSFFNISLYRHSILCVTACSFITGSLSIPLNAYEASKGLNINLSDIAFVARVEKLIDRAKKYKDKLESGKLIEVMLEIKTEVEGYTGKSIDMDAQLDQIEKDAIKQGAQFKKGEMSQIRKLLKGKSKKHHHKALYIAECNMYDIPFEHEEYEFLYKSASKHDKKEDKEEVEIPLRVTVGVTASLCGYFLKFIPHPLVQTAANFLISAGILMTAEGTITRVEENQQKEKDKK